MRKIFLFIIVLAILGACSSKTTTTGTANNVDKYSEDLSVWRPKETLPADSGKNTSKAAGETKKNEPLPEAKFAVNKQLDTILDSISKVNLQNGHVDGYTIQVYSGTKREEALNAKKALSTALPNLDSDVQYVQPNFRVRTGKYIDRFEAQKDYLAVKKHFPNAILIPDRISIN
jgi:hypothetical protein